MPKPNIVPTKDDPWIHRSSKMKCANCMWYVEKAPSSLLALGLALVVGRCRRHAPTMGGFPVVYTTDWCGDHKLDESKV